MARPLKKIDEEQVFKLAQIMCTHAEIAAFFNVDKSTISKRFSSTINKGHEVGKMSIRRKQFALATTNAALCIWLGKQYLGQKEHAETNDTELINAKIEIIHVNGAEKDQEHRFQKYLK